METTLTLPAYAKINWTLEVLGRRPDGYHELRTILQTISLADELHFALREREIAVRCEAPGVPADERNLVHRAADLLRREAGIERGVEVTIVKRIPSAAGLGGGSSDAASTLLALRHLWGIEIGWRELCRLGAMIGSDVPFFLLGGTALGIGRGDEVYPLADAPSSLLLLLNAGVEVPTREAYGHLPPELTNPARASMMPFSLEAAYRSAVAPSEVAPLLRNDLESAVLARYPLLDEVRRRLIAAGARAALMAGSGSTIYGIFDSAATRDRAREELSDSGWWCAEARTLGRGEYLKAFPAPAAPER
jgi:4-diphosphocytidyl-2-C-methyl-D-erythritol kinase